MTTWRIIVGDVRETLATLPAASVQCCVTSPPYWSLRDYGHAAQLGLEPTPDTYVANMVAVFREVRRVLRDDGTLWLNIGDSYAANRSYQVASTKGGAKHSPAQGALGASEVPDGLKPKDLVGIPWRVAFALQQPYYAGTIKEERDRIWLAAMLDAEGCVFIHRRKAGQHNGQGYYRQNDSFGPGVEIANTSVAVVERIMALVDKGSICSQGPEQTNGRRRQTIYRWNLRTTESRDFVRELYPYLVAKQHQARLLYGCPASGDKAAAAHQALMELHRGSATSVDFDEPPSLYEPGYYLRSDVIWSKLNPMPESVTDRPTKAHEYLFLLTKSARYYYDAAAIREPYAASTLTQFEKAYTGEATKDYTGAGAQNPSDVKRRIVDKQRGHGRRHAGFNDRWDDMEKREQQASGANKRSVWTVATQPFPGAHFAVMPEALVEPCILAGSRMGDTVLDPFAGSGTVGAVSTQLGRSFVGCELNPAYVEMARRRIGKVAPLLASEIVA